MSQGGREQIVPFTTSSRSPTAQRKAAELLSTTGALVLGVGIGLILPVVGSAIGWLTIALGIVSHGWGMYAKNQVEAQAAEELPWWHRLLYWGCWLGLAALAVYLVAQFVRA